MADVLFVDDDPDLLQSLARSISPLIAPYRLTATSSVEQALATARLERPSVAVIDLCIDEKRGVDSGFSLLGELLSVDPTMRVIVVTGHGALEFGVRAVSLGAAHFVEKPADPKHLAVLIRDSVVQSNLRRECQRLREQQRAAELLELGGESRGMQQLREQLQFLAISDQPVLICGETGVGKGLCARAIHRLSNRRIGNFVHCHPNFGGGDLVQSQIFGHKKGAFTGATESRRGLVLEAHRGTLFIDELDEVPHQTQVALLDVIQEHRVRAVGSDAFEAVDCRFIAATNRPLDESLTSGRVRRDLHHRLAHAVVRVPPLRERREDIPLLARLFLEQYGERNHLNVFDIHADGLAVIRAHEWPGNVRELKAAVETAASFAHFKGRSAVVADDFSVSSSASRFPATPSDGSFYEQVENFKARLIREALELHGGNKARVADTLQLDRGTVRRILERGQ
jgi:DNA-binding NtrC family response regulator